MIFEGWQTRSGQTGTGVIFFDPATKKWRQIWMSPRFHIDYSGNLDDRGNLILEGRIYPDDGQASSTVRGIYSRKKDDSITKEFLKFDQETKNWDRFFIGVARRPKLEKE